MDPAEQYNSGYLIVRNNPISMIDEEGLWGFSINAEIDMFNWNISVGMVAEFGGEFTDFNSWSFNDAEFGLMGNLGLGTMKNSESYGLLPVGESFGVSMGGIFSPNTNSLSDWAGHSFEADINILPTPLSLQYGSNNKNNFYGVEVGPGAGFLVQSNYTSVIGVEIFDFVRSKGINIHKFDSGWEQRNSQHLDYNNAVKGLSK